MFWRTGGADMPADSRGGKNVKNGGYKRGNLHERIRFHFIADFLDLHNLEPLFHYHDGMGKVKYCPQTARKTAPNGNPRTSVRKTAPITKRRSSQPRRKRTYTTIPLDLFLNLLIHV